MGLTGRGEMIVDPMLSALLVGADLDEVSRALSRETVIRNVMAETGETREVVIEQVEAMEASSQEAVLDLTGGRPTMLRDALADYVEALAGRDDFVSPYEVAAELDALLVYPWPAEEATIATHDLNRSLRLNVLTGDRGDFSVSMGARNPHVIFECEDSDLFTTREVGDVATAVHRAVLARVIGDRDHHVQLSSTDRRSLLAWLERPNGSWSPDGERRLTVDAVGGGGILVRTRPYRYQPPAGRAGRAIPSGLCPYREEHEPHEVTIGSLAPFWCTADQSQREPYRSERLRGQA